MPKLKRYSKKELLAFIKFRGQVSPANKDHLMNWVDSGGYSFSRPHKWVDAGGWNYCDRCFRAQSSPNLPQHCEGTKWWAKITETVGKKSSNEAKNLWAEETMIRYLCLNQSKSRSQKEKKQSALIALPRTWFKRTLGQKSASSVVGLTDFMTLHDLPYGTLIRHANKLYFKSRGLDHDILTGTDGMWHFLHEGICSKWKT